MPINKWIWWYDRNWLSTMVSSQGSRAWDNIIMYHVDATYVCAFFSLEFSGIDIVKIYKLVKYLSAKKPLIWLPVDLKGSHSAKTHITAIA